MRLEGVVYRHRGSRAFVLGPVDCEGPADRPWLILGRAGAGKSTLLRLLGGALQPTVGVVRGCRPGEESGYLPQLPERALAGRNVAEDLSGELRPPETLRRKLRAALAEVGLGDLSLAGRSRQLSSGERRRLSLALVQLSGTPHWALDEPDAGLDVLGQEALVEWVQRRSRTGRLWIATHRPGLYRGLEPWVLVLERGQVVAEGAAEEALARDPARRILDGPVQSIETIEDTRWPR